MRIINKFIALKYFSTALLIYFILDITHRVCLMFTGNQAAVQSLVLTSSYNLLQIIILYRFIIKRIYTPPQKALFIIAILNLIPVSVLCLVFITSKNPVDKFIENTFPLIREFLIVSGLFIFSKMDFNQKEP